MSMSSTKTRASMTLALGCGALLACTPQPAKLISVENAQVICTEKARDAIRPRGAIGASIGTGGHHSSGIGVGISVSTDLLQGRNPEVVYAECVRKRSGHTPVDPLIL